MIKRYETAIGLEVHVQLATLSKVFCSCSTEFGTKPNKNTCPVCLGLPGALPVLNKKVVDYAIMVGLATNCEINKYSKFDRKNYFYPDLPKGYQITQYAQPLAQNGFIETNTEDGRKMIRIKRIHIEEDAGKLLHNGSIYQSRTSLVDYNRAGIPLLEIVSDPDICTPVEARTFLVQLKRILEYLGVSDCNMEEGSLRCDVNISIKPEGQKEMGVRTELKNINSFRAVEKALEYEINRQRKELENSGIVRQETRTWDDSTGRTVLMRGKEGADDYLYFPEPDLLALEIENNWIEGIREKLPELPADRMRRFVSDYGLRESDAELLIDTRELANFFEECVSEYPDAGAVLGWIIGDFLHLLKEGNMAVSECKLMAENLGRMLKLIDKGLINTKIAKEVFREMFVTGEKPEIIIEKKGLKQITDKVLIEEIVLKIIKNNQELVEDIREGREKAFAFLVGQVMKETSGKANPGLVNRVLREKINE